MDKIDLSPDQKIYFRDQLRNARNEAIKDAEGFTELLFVFERLGSFLTHNKEYLNKHREDLDKHNEDPTKNDKPPKFKEGLNDYKEAITGLVNKSKLAKNIPKKLRAFHTPLHELYDIVLNGRNSAMHQGAYARHLTQHAIELSLILEDALMNNLDKVCDFMVRDPFCAYLWQPLSFIRQTMLSNSFSYMPVCEEKNKTKTWKLISDYEVAKYLIDGDRDERKKRLATDLEEAVSSGKIKLLKPEWLESDQTIQKALNTVSEIPMLIFSDGAFQNLIGILTPFDLL